MIYKIFSIISLPHYTNSYTHITYYDITTNMTQNLIHSTLNVNVLQVEQRMAMTSMTF